MRSVAFAHQQKHQEEQPTPRGTVLSQALPPTHRFCFQNGLRYVGVFGFLWLSLLSCGREHPASSLYTKQSQPIIGGQEELQHPAVGALLRDGAAFCTGTLVAPRVVLTAGHCIDSARVYAQAKSQLKFRIDLADSNQPNGFLSHFFDIFPQLLVSHPQWNPDDLLNGYDVGVVILQQPVPSNIASPIPINESSLDASWEKKSLLFLGYGLISSNPYAVSPNRKFGAPLPITQIGLERITVEENAKGLCHGDSGGPGLAQIEGEWRVISVTSYGTSPSLRGSNPPRSQCNGAAVCMRVDAYRSFVKQWIQRFQWESKATCSDDTACGSCGKCDTQQQCTIATQPSFAQYCKPCKQDSDCQTDGRCLQTADGWRCMVQCSANGCCPADAICQTLPLFPQPQALCIPHTAQCPPQPCTQDTECGLAESCVEGQCKTQTSLSPAKLCHPCNQPEDCGGNELSCHATSLGKHCLASCTTTGICPKGFSCRSPGPGREAICLPEGNSCPITCTATTDCPQSWECSQGQCRPIAGAAITEDCTNTPCQAGLLCTTTLDGRRCYPPCYVPEGELGGICLPLDSCNQGGRCLSVRGLKHKFCFAQCQQSSDCPHGGDCVVGACVCKTDSSCNSDAYCERPFQIDTGFCVPRAKVRSCPADMTCHFSTEGSRCIPNTVASNGGRRVGQACDPFAPCHKGLECVEFRRGAGVCAQPCQRFEDCTTGVQCEQGFCLCRSSVSCPTGRICQFFFLQPGDIGICTANPNYPCTTQTSTTPPSSTASCMARSQAQIPCAMDGECPSPQRCIAGHCILAPPPEPPSEPPLSEFPAEIRTEPHLQDAGPDVDSTRPDHSPPDQNPDSPPSSPPTENTANDTILRKGCQCHSNVSIPPEIPAFQILLMFLLISLVLLRRQTKTVH